MRLPPGQGAIGPRHAGDGRIGGARPLASLRLHASPIRPRGDAMSLLDQVRKLEQQVVDRLKELEPLTREYEQLRKLAERLGMKYSPKPAETDADADPSSAARST